MCTTFLFSKPTIFQDCITMHDFTIKEPVKHLKYNKICYIRKLQSLKTKHKYWYVSHTAEVNNNIHP